MTMEDYIGGLYSPQLLERRGDYMSSSHAIHPVMDSRASLDKQSPSFERPSSLSWTVPTSGRQIDAACPREHAGVSPAEPPVRSPRACATGTAPRQSDRSDDSTFFDDEYQVIFTSNLRAADHNSPIPQLNDQAPHQWFDDAEVNDIDHQMDAGVYLPTTESATLACDSTILPPSYTASKEGQRQNGNTFRPDVAYDNQATGAPPDPSPPHDAQVSTQVETFDTSSMLCSKAYATGGAVNQDISCRTVMPNAPYNSRPIGEQEARPTVVGMAERHTGPLNVHSDGVQAAQLPDIMEAVGQLSADADSTMPNTYAARPETSLDSTIQTPPPSEAQRFLNFPSPQTAVMGPPHTPAHPTYVTGSQHHAWMTPPSSKQSSPHFPITHEVSFSDQHSLFPTSAEISPTAAHFILSPPKTPINGPPLVMNEDLFDRAIPRSVYDNGSQLRGYAAPPASSKTLPSTGRTHTPDDEGPDLSPSKVADAPTYLPQHNSPASESIHCEHCQKSFYGNTHATQLRSLKRHMETDHGGEEYECMSCGGRLKRSDYRVRHMQSKKHNFQFPPTPPSRKRDLELESILQSLFRKVVAR